MSKGVITIAQCNDFGTEKASADGMTAPVVGSDLQIGAPRDAQTSEGLDANGGRHEEHYTIQDMQQVPPDSSRNRRVVRISPHWKAWTLLSMQGLHRCLHHCQGCRSFGGVPILLRVLQDLLSCKR